MDQTILNWIAAAIMGCAGWFARMLWDRQEAHSKALNDAQAENARAIADVRILLASGYVTNTKLSEVMGELKEDLRYIRDRLDETPQRRSGDPRP